MIVTLSSRQVNPQGQVNPQEQVCRSSRLIDSIQQPDPKNAKRRQL